MHWYKILIIDFVWVLARIFHCKSLITTRLQKLEICKLLPWSIACSPRLHIHGSEACCSPSWSTGLCVGGAGREKEGGKKERKGTTCTRVGGGQKEAEREAEELGLVYNISSFLHAANQKSKLHLRMLKYTFSDCRGTINSGKICLKWKEE